MLTCAPGPEVYELCGHEAIRIQGEGIDSVWNYGTFDFEQPGFVYRFVKGETDYMLSAVPFQMFMAEYVWGGRKVSEQELNLSGEEARKLLGMLREESRPENRVYRYNYVRDNCATRITDRLDRATERRIIYPDTVRYGTFRNEMRRYHAGYPWYQFGIDLALGSGIDMPVNAREEMFVPIEMMRTTGNAHYEDGEPLVKSTRVIFEGVPDATLPATPWYLTPMAVSFFWLVICCITVGWQFYNKRLFRPIYSLWFGILGIAGCVIAFLVFVSVHEATSPNVLLFWLNPLQLLPAITIWSRRCRNLNICLMTLDALIQAVLLCTWPIQAQSANPAFFPLMGATLLLALGSLPMLMHNGKKISS